MGGKLVYKHLGLVELGRFFFFKKTPPPSQMATQCEPLARPKLTEMTNSAKHS